ncbi:MAG: archaetidylserine decarboxylase [Polyangiaceae bacterium]
MPHSERQRLHRHPAFLRAYRFLPHRLLNRTVASLTAARRPAWAVDAAIRFWTRRDRIELGDFEARRYESLDDFFLRRLRPGARPIGQGVVSPADGNLVGYGSLDPRLPLTIKAQRLGLHRVVNGRHYDLELSNYDGGVYAVVFLTPRGYHFVHMPVDGVVRDVRWIPGRYFPQNETALQHIPRIYERNERAVLRCRARAGWEFLMVLVGASLIGGIVLHDLPQDEWMQPRPTPFGRGVARGEELGHFAFGSTVVLLLPRGVADPIAPTDAVHMGQQLFALQNDA